MEIKYQTKEESNKTQQEAFFKLSKSERFCKLLQLMDNLKDFQPKDKKDTSDNFVIEIKRKIKE